MRCKGVMCIHIIFVAGEYDKHRDSFRSDLLQPFVHSKGQSESERVKYPHSPYYIMHSVLGYKKRQKQYMAIGKTDLFNNSIGLCGNFTIESFQTQSKTYNKLRRHRGYRIRLRFRNVKFCRNR